MRCCLAACITDGHIQQGLAEAAPGRCCGRVTAAGVRSCADERAWMQGIIRELRLQGLFQEDNLNAWLFWKGFFMVSSA